MECQSDCCEKILSSRGSKMVIGGTDDAEVRDCRLDKFLSSIADKRSVVMILKWIITLDGVGIPSIYSSTYPELKSRIDMMNSPRELSRPIRVKFGGGRASEEDMRKVSAFLNRAGISCALPEFNGDPDERYIFDSNSWIAYRGVRPKAAFLLTYTYSDG